MKGAEDHLEGGEDNCSGGIGKSRKNKKRRSDRKGVGSLRIMMMIVVSPRFMTAAVEHMKVGDPAHVSRAGFRKWRKIRKIAV